MFDNVPSHLGANLRALRIARGLTQAQIAKLSAVPRATWANLESGVANPTIVVLLKVAAALQVSIEELISPPKASARLYRAGELASRTRGAVSVRKLLPDPIPGLEIERIDLPPRARMTGIPHRAGTREYLACESGVIVLTASGEGYRLEPGDVVVFRGDQPHAYANDGIRVAVGYSIVAIAPPTGT